MSPKFEIIEAKPFHCGQISRILRYEHQRQLMLLGISIHAQMRAIFDASYYRKAWMIDGKLAGLGGVEGSLMGSTGLIWMALSERAMRYPVAIVRTAREQLEAISVTKTELYTTVISDDPAAQRLAVFLGFQAADGGGGMAYSRDGRRTLLRYINDEPGLRVPVGRGYQIGMIRYAERPDAAG